MAFSRPGWGSNVKIREASQGGRLIKPRKGGGVEKMMESRQLQSQDEANLCDLRPAPDKARGKNTCKKAKIRHLALFQAPLTDVESF